MFRRTEIAGPAGSSYRRSRGISLVELVVFISIIAVGVAGILKVMDYMTRASADPLVQKQALAIAEAYLEEVLAMPFTYCDPDDLHAATAQSAALDPPAPPTDTTLCATTLEGIGPEGETRAGALPFDNVSDYHGFSGIPANVDGTAITGLGAYQAAITVTPQILTNGANPVPLAASLRVTVTVIGPNATVVVLDGYRTRYAPNALP